MPEAVLLSYLGGELGAKKAAVEEVVKYLPAVCQSLFNLLHSYFRSVQIRLSPSTGTVLACTFAQCLQAVTAYTKDAISETIMPVGLTDEKLLTFDVSKPFTYQIEFTFPPRLSWKRPYKGLKVQ